MAIHNLTQQYRSEVTVSSVHIFGIWHLLRARQLTAIQNTHCGTTEGRRGITNPITRFEEQDPGCDVEQYDCIRNLSNSKTSPESSTRTTYRSAKIPTNPALLIRLCVYEMHRCVLAFLSSPLAQLFQKITTVPSKTTDQLLICLMYG